MVSTNYSLPYQRGPIVLRSCYSHEGLQPTVSRRLKLKIEYCEMMLTINMDSSATQSPTAADAQIIRRGPAPVQPLQYTCVTCGSLIQPIPSSITTSFHPPGDDDMNIIAGMDGRRLVGWTESSHKCPVCDKVHTIDRIMQTEPAPPCNCLIM
jgi:predicted RNA-binding Zn-ribbon protein involved in translation (DUF1610 family)